eukprot:g4636.t1
MPSASSKKKKPRAEQQPAPAPKEDAPAPTQPPDFEGTDRLPNQIYSRLLGTLRHKYERLAAKPEWWWIQDECLELVAKQLKKHSYAFIDGFLPDSTALLLRQEVRKCDGDGRLKPAGVVNGKTGDGYVETSTRGDRVGWFNTNGTDSWKVSGSSKDGVDDVNTPNKAWPYGPVLDGTATKVSTLVAELKQFFAPGTELHRINTRSHHMVACYPGSGARYTKHYDNDGKHAQLTKRVLTTLVYLNPVEEIDGGELCVYNAVQEDADVLRAAVAPKLGRLLLFFSDVRVPHEVRPSRSMRYSVTTWFLDNTAGGGARLGKARSAAIYYSKKVYMVTKENPVVIVTVLFLLILIIAVFSAFTSFLQAFLSGTGVAVVYLALFVLLVKLVIRALVFPGSCMLWQQKLEGAYRTDLAKAYYDAVVQLEQLLLVLSGRPAWQKWSPSQAVFGYNILQQIQRNFELLRKEQIPEFVATASTTTSTTPQSFTSEQLELEKRIASVMNTFASLRVEKRDGSCPDTFLRYLFKDVAAAESAYGGGRNVMDEISRTRLTTKDAAVLELKEIAALLKALHEPAETYRGAVKRFFAKATVGSLDSVRGELMQRKPACQMWIPVVSSSSSAAGAPDGGDHDVGTEVVEQSTPTTIGVVDAAFVFSKTHIQKIKAAGSQIAQLLHEAKRKEEQERSHGGGRARAEGVPAQHAEMIGSATTSHMPPGGRGGGGAGAEKTLFETVTADMLEGIDLENNPLQDPVDGSPWNFPAEKLQVLLKLAGNPCVVVFCNPNAGYYESQAFQSDWVDFYHSLGHAVLLFNYRGFGRSGALSSGPAAAASGGQSVVGRCGGGGCADFTKFCVIDRGFASLQRTAELGYGSWAKVGLKSSAYDVCNVQNYLQISCRKILIVDPHDEVIPDLASLRSSKLILSDNRFEQKECEKQLLKVIENYQWLQKLMVLIYTADEEVNYNPPTGAQCQWGPPTGRSSSSRRGPRGAKNRYEPMGTVWSDEQRLFHEMLHGDVGLKWLDEHKRFVRHLFAESPIMFYLRDAFETLCGGLNAGGSTVDDVLSRTEFGAFVDYAHGLRQFLSNLAVWGSMPAASSGGSFVSDLTAARSSDLPAEVTAVERYVYQRRKRAPTRFVNYGGRVMQVADGSREPNNLTSENPPDASAIGDYHRVLAHLLLQQSRAKFRRVVQDVMLLSTEELLSSCPASFGGQEHGKVGSSSSGSSCSSQTRTSTANHTTHTTHVNSSQTAAAANQPHTIGATATASCSPRNTSADTQTDELKYFVVNKLLGLEQLFTLAARCLHRYSTPLLVHASEFREGGGGEVPAASNAAGTRNCCSVAELLVLSDRCMDAIGQGGSTNPSAAAAAAQREAERAIEHGKAIALAEERAAAGGAKPENKNGFLASARSFLFEDDEMPSTAATKSKSKNFLEIEMSDFTTPKSSNASNKRGGTSPSSSTPGVGADVGVDVGGSTNSSAATFEAAAQRMSRGEAERVRAERMTKTGYILHVDCGHNGALSSGDLKHLALRTTLCEHDVEEGVAGRCPVTGLFHRDVTIPLVGAPLVTSVGSRADYTGEGREVRYQSYHSRHSSSMSTHQELQHREAADADRCTMVYGGLYMRKKSVSQKKMFESGTPVATTTRWFNQPVRIPHEEYDSQNENDVEASYENVSRSSAAVTPTSAATPACDAVRRKIANKLQESKEALTLDEINGLEGAGCFFGCADFVTCCITGKRPGDDYRVFVFGDSEKSLSCKEEKMYCSTSLYDPVLCSYL